MFQDIKVSEDLNQAFKDVYRTRSPMAGNKDLTVTISSDIEGLTNTRGQCMPIFESSL